MATYIIERYNVASAVIAKVSRSFQFKSDFFFRFFFSNLKVEEYFFCYYCYYAWILYPLKKGGFIQGSLTFPSENRVLKP